MKEIKTKLQAIRTIVIQNIVYGIKKYKIKICAGKK
jgi:hypothetical protein